jgi:two-component system response regulator RegA
LGQVSTQSSNQLLSQSGTTQRRAIGSVLVVDDDETVVNSWKRAISRERECTIANDAVSAIELAQSQKFDLAITDLRLGTDSGIDVIRAIKKHSPETLVVLCSGYLSVAATVSAMHAGAEIVVFKPITFREILHHIERHDNDALPDLNDTPTLARAEWEHIMRVMADCNGNVSMAARRLGIYRSSLQRRLRKFAPQK